MRSDGSVKGSKNLLFLKKKKQKDFHPLGPGLHSVLSLLSYLLKAPMVKPGTPVVNALARQRAALENVLRALVGLPPNSDMHLEHRVWTPTNGATTAAAAAKPNHREP